VASAAVFRRSGGGAGDPDLRVGGDAAAVGAVGNDLPFAVGLPDLDDGVAVGGHGGFDLALVELAGRIVLGEAGEHDVRIGVFVVDAEQAVIAAGRAGRRGRKAMKSLL
jgi:hypothetical protein